MSHQIKIRYRNYLYNEPPSSERATHKLILTIAIITVTFVFVSASTMLLVSVSQCIYEHDCQQLNGLSHLVFAWADAVVAGILGYLVGSNSNKKGRGERSSHD
jgi:hypothetical protein